VSCDLHLVSHARIFLGFLLFLFVFRLIVFSCLVFFFFFFFWILLSPFCLKSFWVYAIDFTIWVFFILN
jgi:hypothetical protein